MDTGRLAGKVAIVTGGGRGIGLAITRAFVREAARVVVGEIREDLRDALPAAGQQTLFVRADVSDEAQVRRLVEAAATRYGRLDILVNNAAIDVLEDPLVASVDDWDRCLDANLKSAWLCAKHVAPHLSRGGGSIINIASAHAFRTEPAKFPYNISKAGLVALTTSLAVEWGRLHIRVNSIVPGQIRSVRTEAYLQTFTDPATAWGRIVGEYPLGRIGEPEDITGASVFLASDESAFITGTHLRVDGGREALLHSFADIAARPFHVGDDPGSNR
jgi:NAD(P)-dependent dehydrogenase (short-subunit alcohol dehydrogenase family)